MSTPPGRTRPPQLGPDEIAVLVDGHPGWWDVVGGAGREGEGVEVALLGRGESFTAWRVARGGRELAVRVPHRPVAELPQTLAAEHALLVRLPAGVGAVRVAVHEPTPADPTAYLVSSVVPGRVLAPQEWTDDLLADLAGQLARLHVQGRAEGLPAGDGHDLVRTAHAARSWWREHEPDAAATLERAWPLVLAHQEAVQAAAPTAETVLVHGDACLTNVLVDGGRTRLVDWEWAGPGDPARDLAYVGGRVHTAPWYAELKDTRVRRQVEAYAVARADLGRPVDVEALLLRRAGWLVNETYFVSAHFRRVAARGGPAAADYARSADQLINGLVAWLE